MSLKKNFQNINFPDTSRIFFAVFLSLAYIYGSEGSFLDFDVEKIYIRIFFSSAAVLFFIWEIVIDVYGIYLMEIKCFSWFFPSIFETDTGENWFLGNDLTKRIFNWNFNVSECPKNHGQVKSLIQLIARKTIDSHKNPANKKGVNHKDDREVSICQLILHLEI